MPTSNTDIKPDPGKPAVAKPISSTSDYQVTFVESPSAITSLFKQIRELLGEPRVKPPSIYYRGEARLPVTEMPAWYSDLPNQIKTLFEKPLHPIEVFNRKQTGKRALCGIGFALAGSALGFVFRREAAIILGFIAGYALGLVVGAALFKKREYPPEIWQEYRPQAASWVNSLLVHALGLTILVLPFVVERMMTPVKASSTYEIVDISPYLADLPASAKKAGGGGGGGDSSRTPASKGPVPKFEKEQMAPPMAVIPNPNPKLPVQPSLLGPPDLKLPQMAMNVTWGDPQGVLGPYSNGPGTGGGIGSGSGGGIGSGDGGGLGPGSDGGTGGGPFSVGGNVSAPIALYKPEPPYSEEARKAKYQGTVVLWIVVDAQGNVTDVRVVKPLGLGLDEKAVETVHTWKFKPAMRNGTAVTVRVSVEITFRLF